MPIQVHLAAGDTTRVLRVDSNTNTTMAINKPTNVGNGDLMVLKITCNAILNPNTLSITPDTWTLIGSNFSGNGNSVLHTAYFCKEWHTGDPTTWTATIGSDGRDDETFVFKVTGHYSTSPIDAVGAAFVNGTGQSLNCPAVTTAHVGAVLICGISSRNGSSVVAEDTGQPSGMTLIHSKRSRANSSGIGSALAYQEIGSPETTPVKQWTSYLSVNQVYSGYSFAIRPNPPAQQIVDVEPLVIGSSSLVTVSGFSSPIDRGSIDGVLLDFVSDTHITVGTIGDNKLVPFPGSRLLRLANSTEEATLINVPVTPPVGVAMETLESGFNTGEDNSVLFGIEADAGDIMYFDPTKGTIYPDAGWAGDYTGSQTIFLHRASTRRTHSITLITGYTESGEIGIIRTIFKESFIRDIVHWVK